MVFSGKRKQDGQPPKKRSLNRWCAASQLKNARKVGLKERSLDKMVLPSDCRIALWNADLSECSNQVHLELVPIRRFRWRSGKNIRDVMSHSYPHFTCV